MPEPTTAALVEQVRMCVEAADSDIWGNPSKLQAPARAALTTLSERLEAAERERDSWEATAETLGDESTMAALFASEKEEREAAEARVQELERALREIDPEWLAGTFHVHYERLAPEYGYKTRPDSRVQWHQVPELNRSLMIAVAAAVKDEIARAALEPPEPTA